MPDHDLGTAHGKIEIDASVDGVAKTTAEMAALSAAVSAVGAPAAKLDKTLDQVEKSTAEMAKTLEKSQGIMRSIAGDVGRLGKSLSDTMGFTKKYDDAMANALPNMIKYGRQLNEIRGRFNSLRTVSGVFGLLGGGVTSLTKHLSGVNREMNNFPRWTQQVRKYAGVVTAVGVGAAFMSGRMNKGFTALVGFLGKSEALRNGMVNLAASYSMAASGTGKLGKTIRAVESGFKSASWNVRDMYKNLNWFAKGATRAITGAALLTSGLRSVNKVLGPLMSPKAFIGVGAVTAVLSAIQPVTSILLGIVNAIGQLSGAALMLPGVLASLGIAGGVAMVGVKGISEAFKAAALDGEDFEKAIKDLPEGMQNVARTAKGFKDELKEIREQIVHRMWNGFSANLKQLGSNYLPLVARGSGSVADALNGVVLSFMRFMNTGQVMSAWREMFGDSARIVTNLGKGLQPMLRIFTDLAVVGSGVFAELTGGIERTTQKWADFIWEARRTGKLRDWMENGIQGFRDLWRIIRDTSVAIGSLFKGFGGEGQNALARAAAGAERFRNAMDGVGSGRDSGLAKFVRHLEEVSDRLKMVIGILVNGLGGAISNAAGLIKAFGDAFSSRFANSLTNIIGLATQMIAVLAKFEIFASIIGSVLGAVAAMRLLLFIVKPLIVAMKLFIGAMMVSGGLSNMMLGAAVAMDRFATKAGVVGRVTRGAQSALLSLGTILSGPVLAGLMAVTVGFALYKQSADEHSRAQEQIRDDYEASGKSAKEFADAVMDANGVLSPAAMDSMTQAVGKLRDAWKGKSEDDSDFWGDKIVGNAMDSWKPEKQSVSWSSFFDMNPFDSKDGNENSRSGQLDEDAAKYKAVVESMRELDMTDEELANQLVSSSGTWAEFRQRVVDSGDGGKVAAEELDKLRGTVERTKAAADEVGPSALEVANGLEKIAAAGASAEDKLDGLMTVMRGLGLIETSAHEAAMALAEELSGVVQEAIDTVNKEANLGADALVMEDGWLNVDEENARSLYDALDGLREKYMQAVISGGDARAEFDKMLPTLLKLGEQYRFTEAEMTALLTKYGFVPEQITTILSVQGSEQAKVDLTNILLQIDNIRGKGPTRIDVQTEEAANAIKSLGIAVTEWDPETKTMKVNIPEGLGEETRAKIQAILDAAMIGQPLQAQAPEVKPPAPGEQAPMPSPPILPGVAPQPTPPAGGFTPMQPVPLLPAKTPTPLPPDPAPPIPAPIVETPISPPITPPPPLPPITVVVDPTGAEARMGEFQIRIEAVMNGARFAVENFAASVPGILDSAASAAYGSGDRLGQGFADGISSKADAVRAAAMRLAEAASEPLPRSPAKIGPFSGKGWTPYRGITLAEGFAQGIMTGTPLAQLASLNMAQAVADAMDSVRGQFQMPQTAFGANDFGPGLTQYYRDPEVSDRELLKDRQKKEAEDAKAKREAARSTRQGAADSLPEAEEKVRSANERVAKAEEALAKAKESDGKNAEEGVTNAEKSLREAIEAQYEATQGLEKARSQGAGLAPTGAAGALKANKDREDYVTAMNDIAKTFGLEMTSDFRPGDPGNHGNGTAADFSNGMGNTDQQLAFAEFMQANFKPWIKELIYDDPRFAGKEIKDGNNVDSTFYDGAGDHTNHVHLAVNAAPEFSGVGAQAFKTPFGAPGNRDGINPKPSIDPTRTDLSKDEVASLIIAKGREMKMSDKQIASALATAMVERELQNLPGGPDSSTGVFQQQDFDEWTKGGTRDRMNVSDAATSYYEHLQGVNPTLTAGQQAQAVQRSKFPDKYDERMSEAELLLARLDTGVTAGITVPNDEDADTLLRLQAENPALAEALRIAQDPNSTDEQIVQSLQAIDQGMVGLNETDAGILLEQKNNVMMDRGMKEYDPYEGALKTDMEKFEFGLQSAQSIWGMLGMLKQGFENIKQLGALMIRGVSGTKDVNSMVDGFQAVAGTVGEVVSAVGSIASMVGTIAATAGMMIPGLGQIGTVIGAVTGGIGNVNGIIDLAQDVMKAGGRMVGGALAGFLGGENGQLQGNVKTLLDFNDNTIKSWGDRNPTDKSIRDIPFTPGSGGRDPNQASSFRDLNVYQGPGGNPMDSMNAAMFAVKAHSTGVFAG